MAEWKVYYFDFNRNRIGPYDLFRHGKFPEYIQKHQKQCKSKEEFSDKVKSELMYYYWSKCEWEVIITKEENRIILTPWIGSRGEVSLNVTDDESFEWAAFYEKVARSRVVRDGSIKIDVYDQVMFKFVEFVDYCWEHRKDGVSKSGSKT